MVVVLVCWMVLLTSVLGSAVHLFPPSVVMKAPRGRFGLVAISSRVGVVCRVAIPVATRGRNYSSLCNRSNPPFKGARRSRNPRPLGPSNTSQIHPGEISSVRRRWFWGGGDVAEQVESRGAPASVDDEVGHDMVLLDWDSTGRRRERRERVELFEV